MAGGKPLAFRNPEEAAASEIFDGLEVSGLPAQPRLYGSAGSSEGVASQGVASQGTGRNRWSTPVPPPSNPDAPAQSRAIGWLTRTECNAVVDGISWMYHSSEGYREGDTS